MHGILSVDSGKTFVDVISRILPLGVDRAVEVVLSPPHPSRMALRVPRPLSELLPRSGRAFVAMIIIMVFGRWRLSCTRYAGRPEENWDDLVCLEESQPAFVRVDEICSIEESPVVSST